MILRYENFSEKVFEAYCLIIINMKKLWFLVAVIFLMVFNFSSSSGQVKADEIVERKSIQFGAAQYWGKMTLRGEYPTDEKLNSFLKLIFQRKLIKNDPALTNPIKDTFSIADLVLEKEISYSPEFKTKVKLWLDNTINYYEFREELIKHPLNTLTN